MYKIVAELFQFVCFVFTLSDTRAQKLSEFYGVSNFKLFADERHSLSVVALMH